MTSITATADTSTPIADLGTSEDFLGIVDDTSGLLEELLLSAVSMGEAYTGRKFFQRTYGVKFGLDDTERYTNECLGFQIELAPIVSVTGLTMSTKDADGNIVLTPLTDFELEASDFYPILDITADVSNINTKTRNPFTLTLEAGYVTLPPAIVTGLRQHVAFLYTNRGDVASESEDALPEVVKRSYGQHRILRPAYA